MAETRAMVRFREAVLTGLTELKTETANIVARLDKLNGSVARHESDLGALKVADAKHEAVLASVATLQADVQALKASTTVTDTKIALTEKYAKQLWAVGGATILALWQNAPKLLALVDGK